MSILVLLSLAEILWSIQELRTTCSLFNYFFITSLYTSKCGKNSSITLLTPNKNFSHFHPLINKDRKVMIVEFYWLYLNRLLLLQWYCATTIKLFWHISLNISAWTCQLCTSGAAVQCQELLVTLRSLFTIQRIERRVSEYSCLQCCPVPCHPPWLWPDSYTEQPREVFYQRLEAWEVLGSGNFHSPVFKVNRGKHCSAPRELLQSAEDKWWEKGRTMKLSKQMSRLGLGNF